MATLLRTAINHPVVPVIMGGLVALDGPGNVVVRSAALIFCAAWFCYDIGQEIYRRPWQKAWKFISFSALCVVITLVTIFTVRWMLESKLEEIRKEVDSHLTGTMQLSSSGIPSEAIFSIVNSSNSTIPDYAFMCRINLATYGKGDIVLEDVKERLIMRQGKPPLGPHGDGESVQCMSGLVNLSLYCADVTVNYDYVIETEPGVWYRKLFHFVTRSVNGKFDWYIQPAMMIHSPCESADTVVSDTSAYKRLTVCPSGCNYKKLQVALNSLNAASCGTIIYVDKTESWENVHVPGLACDKQHQMIVEASIDPKEATKHPFGWKP